MELLSGIGCKTLQKASCPASKLTDVQQNIHITTTNTKNNLKLYAKIIIIL